MIDEEKKTRLKSFIFEGTEKKPAEYVIYIAGSAISKGFLRLIVDDVKTRSIEFVEDTRGKELVEKISNSINDNPEMPVKALNFGVKLTLTSKILGKAGNDIETYIEGVIPSSIMLFSLILKSNKEEN